MALLRCSSSLLVQLGAAGAIGDPAERARGCLGDWCASKIPLGSRPAVLFMSERTLLSFVIFEGKPVDAQALGAWFWRGLAQVLAMEGCKKKQVAKVVDSYSELFVVNVGSASRTTQMNSLARDYRHLVQVYGGLKRCDIGAVIESVNHRPRKRLAFATPAELARKALA